MIGSSENRISYNGNGIATEFAYTFKILEKSDIKVLHVANDGTEELLTKDYYVDMEKSVVLYPGYAPGAEIPEQNRPPILPVGERLVIYREVPITQESALDKHWPFNVIEAGLDKLTIICQQLFDRLQRSFYVSESTSTNFDTKVPVEAGKTFRVKDDGTGFEVTEDPGKVIDGAKALLKQTTEQAEFAKEQADASSQSAVNAQNAANTAEKIASDLGLVDEAVQTAVASATTASDKADVATAKAVIATDKANEATLAANTATAKADAANTSATNAAQSYANADAIATQLTEYLATKETLTAPAVDKTLLIEGAAADSKVVGELKSDLTKELKYLREDGTEIIFNDWVKNLWGSYSHNVLSSGETPIDLSKYSCVLLTVQNGYHCGYRVFNEDGSIYETRWWFTGTVGIVPQNGKKYGFALGRTDESDITLEESENIKVYIYSPVYTEKKLTETKQYSENLLNLDAVHMNKFINLNPNNIGKMIDDSLVDNSQFFITDLINVNINDYLSILYTGGYRNSTPFGVFYSAYYFNSDKILMSYLSPGAYQTIKITDSNVRYVAFAIEYYNYPNYKAMQIVRSAENPHRYTPYKLTLESNGNEIPYRTDVFSWMGKTLLTYGDSITQFGAWQYQVRDYFKLKKWINAGISGSTVSNKNNSKWWINNDGSTYGSEESTEGQPEGCTLVEGYFCNPARIATIPQTGIDGIIFMGGTNDMANNVPLGEVGFDDNTTFKGAMCIALKAIMERCPDVTIIVATLLNGKSMSSNVNLPDYAKNSLGLTTQDYADATVEVAKYMALPCINLHDTCMINPFNRASYMRDNDHPTYAVEHAGATRISRVFIGAMKCIEPNVYDSYLY